MANFNAEITKGYIIKVIIDTLCSAGISRAIFTLTKAGIKLRQSDKDFTILYDVYLPRENIKNYKCIRDLTISVNAKHMRDLLKNIKKKDRLIMSIDDKIKGKFKITVKPDGARELARTETNSIPYQEVIDNKMLTLPDDSNYQYPMVIGSTDFQKLKRLTANGKTIEIVIQKTIYMCFTSEESIILDSALELGDYKDYYALGECKYCENLLEHCECECAECGEYTCDCWCECDACGEYKSICNCDVTYQTDYHSAVLSKLIKLPGLCTQMQFYAPTVAQYPLRIDINAGQGGYTLGKIQVYIKDVQSIEYEAHVSDEKEEVIQIVKGKAKKKK